MSTVPLPPTGGRAAPAPSGATVPVEQYLALAHLTARLQQRNSALENELRATTELLLKPDWSPAQKVSLFAILNDLGSAPGRPVAARIADYSPTTLGVLAHKTGISAKQFSKHYDSFRGVYFSERRMTVDAPPRPAPGPEPEPAPGAPPPGGEESSPPRREPQREPPAKRTQVFIAPKDGPTWAALNHPAGLPVPETPKLDKEAEAAKRKRREEKEKLAKAEAILAQCAHCGCSSLDMLDLRLTCKNCGGITTIAEAKRPKKPGRRAGLRWTRKEAPRPEEPEPDPEPTAPAMGREESSVATKPAPVQLTLDDLAAVGQEESSAPITDAPPPPAPEDYLVQPQYSVPRVTEESSHKVNVYIDPLSRTTSLAEESSAPMAAPPAQEESSAPITPPMAQEESSCPIAAPPAPGLPAREPSEEERRRILDEVVDEFYPVVESFSDHIVMVRRKPNGKGPKYITPKDADGRDLPLSKERLREHFLGTLTVGTRTAVGDIRAPSGATVRALAWDADPTRPDDWARLLDAARLLAARGLSPVLSKNPTKENSGHLWLFLDAPLDAQHAQLAAHKLAPMLAAVGERFPDLSTTTGNRIRLPGGCFPAPDHSDPPFLVGYVPADTRLLLEWFPGTSWQGWMAATSQSPAAILATQIIPADLRPAPQPPQPVHRPVGPLPGQSAGRFDFAKWSRENPISHLVDTDRGGMCFAPWRNETQPSVKVYTDGHWHDFGPDKRHGVDAFDFYCAANNCWDESENKPDRAAGLRLLGYKPGEGAAAADDGPSLPLFEDPGL